MLMLIHCVLLLTLIVGCLVFVPPVALVAFLSKVVILLLLIHYMLLLTLIVAVTLFCGVALGDFSSFCKYLTEEEREREKELVPYLNYNFDVMWVSHAVR